MLRACTRQFSICRTLWRQGISKKSQNLLSLSRVYSQGVRQFSTASEDLEKAKARLSVLTEDPGNDVKLKLYSLYKQATLGRCNTKQPGMLDMVGRAKWNAWNSLGSLSQEDAVKEYCQVVEQLVSPFEGKSPRTDSSEGAAPPAQSSDTIVITKKDGVYTIRLNRPSKKNALLLEMYDDICAALDQAAKDPSVRVAVTTGTGDYYCSGTDLSNFTDIPPDGPEKMAEKGMIILRKFVDAFINFPKPLVAAVNGPAIGISVTIMALYDFVYSSDAATFQTPFTQTAQSPEGCSSLLFPAIMGPAKANEFLLLNQKLTAQEAFERNLVTRVFPASEFDSKVEELLKYMAQLPPQTFQTSKKLMRDHHGRLLEEVNAKECALLKERWLHEEYLQAIMTFFQRKDKSKK